MSPEDNQIRLILEGRQIGADVSFTENGKTIWSSIGLQLHDGKFKIYIDEIEEGKMAAEEYRREQGLSFTNVSDALDWIRQNTRFDPGELHPRKGQKRFNPAFVE